jgi:Mg2+-importing ATPase
VRTSSAPALLDDPPEPVALTLALAATTPADQVLQLMSSTSSGLTTAQAAARLAVVGPNALHEHAVSPLAVLARQLRSPLLLLLAVTAAVSAVLGEAADAAIIGVILVASVVMGFVNELRAGRASDALHQRIRHLAVVLRDGRPAQVDVADLVPGDVVRLRVGSVVPADVRLLSSSWLECDESLLTGESAAVAKDAAPTVDGADSAMPTSCALMGTVVRSGSATAVVVTTGPATSFGRMALALGTALPETEFQVGLRRFSMLLMQVALVLSALILVANVLLQRRLIDAVLFSLAIAVGITPQLLPAVVSTCLAAGSRRLTAAGVLVKRLVCIEDLGNLDLLVTDKTGTLTQGRITFDRSLPAPGVTAADLQVLGLLVGTAAATGESVAGGDPLDLALADARSPRFGPEQPSVLAGWTRVDQLAFDHERQLGSALVDGPDGRVVVVKGAPEAVLSRCTTADPSVVAQVDAVFGEGARVIAVATAPAQGERSMSAALEQGLVLRGLLVFHDPLRTDCVESLQRLARLGVDVKIATGDNPLVAQKVCNDLGLEPGATVTGTEIELMSDAELTATALGARVFARVTPEQKARLIRLLRHRGRAVGFLGDGVNDALALHAADVGISVESGSDVAKDAADVILTRMDLGVLADGVAEGRRTFANTIKYVLMGTSSNFGNMFSAAAASTVLTFLPMLPGQILLNNLLYDTSQLTIPTDHVDDEQLKRPAHWDLGAIRRFMVFFGAISSLFDFLTFALLLGVLHAGPTLFRTGWFVESLATQTLVIFAVRTHRVPFLRSRASRPVLLSAITVVLVGALLPFSPLAGPLGFTALPMTFFLALVAFVLVYLVLIETGKRVFYRHDGDAAAPDPVADRARRLRRRASRFSTRTSL